MIIQKSEVHAEVRRSEVRTEVDVRNQNAEQSKTDVVEILNNLNFLKF